MRNKTYIALDEPSALRPTVPDSDFVFDPGMAGVISYLSSFDRPLTQPEIMQVIAEARVTEDSVRPWIAFDDGSYRRNAILRLPHVEMLVLCWMPGQFTPIHDHAGSTGAVRVLRGTATEITYRRSVGSFLVPGDSRDYFPGELFSSHDAHIHRVGNFSGPDDMLITLHCYSRPLDGFHIYSGSDLAYGDSQPATLSPAFDIRRNA